MTTISHRSSTERRRTQSKREQVQPSARHPQLEKEVLEGPLLGDPVAGDDLPAAAPGHHHGRDHQAQAQRDPGALGDLGQVGAEE